MSSKSHARGRSIGLTRVSSAIGFCRETVTVLGLREGVIELFFHSRGFGCVGLLPNGLRAPIADTWIGLKQYDHVWLFIPHRVHCFALFRSSVTDSLIPLCAVFQSVLMIFPLTGALPFPFLLFSFFNLYAALSSTVYSFLCLLGFVVALDSSLFLFPPPLSFDPLPWSFLNESSSLKISSLRVTSLRAATQSSSFSYSCTESRLNASFGIDRLNSCLSATPESPT